MAPPDFPVWQFALLLAVTALVRLIGASRPLVGHFATKNVVYAMIARNWASGRAPLWQPTLDCLAGEERVLHLLEVPISSYTAGGCWAVFGGSLDVWGRLVSVAFSTASVALMFRLVERWHGRRAAWGAAVALSIAPVSIIYGQAFMLEASVVCFTLATIWSLDGYLRTARGGWLVVVSCCLGLLLLTKIYMLVLFPALAWMIYRRRRTGPAEQNWSRLGVTAAALIAAAPALSWCAYVYVLSAPGNPMAERVFYSLRDSAADHGSPHPLLAAPDFYRGLLDNLAGVALTPIGLVLALIGVTHSAFRRHGVWLACMAVLVLLLPRKFHEMNYYYLVALPPLTIAVGLGWQRLSARLPLGKSAVAAVLLAASAFSARYAARPAFITPPEDRQVIAAATQLQALSQWDDRVITLHGSTIDLLYYCDRAGWALDEDDPDLYARLMECRRQGARWLVVMAADSPQWKSVNWPNPAFREDGFAIWRVATWHTEATKRDYHKGTKDTKRER